MAVRFVLNGKPVELGAVDPHLNLLSWLRQHGLTGSKEGCAEGECGACAVALLERDEHGGARLIPVNSCLVPLPAVHGQELITVEGVADPDGTLHPVQEAMVAQGGSQCGYCTPGFVISLFCEYYRASRHGFDPESISGNLCRCTGYRPIRDVAAAMTAPHAGDPRLPLLQQAPPALPAFEHASERARFVRPTALAGIFAALAQDPDATLLAGGTDLMVDANQRYARFSSLVSLEAVPELQQLSWQAHELVLGAAVPLARIEAWLAREHPAGVPLLEQALPLFASRLIRNRATLGGSLATASPIGDLAPVLLALDAELTLESARGPRRVPLRDFFAGYRKSVLAPGELLVSAHVPLPAPRHQRFYKVSKRILDDISTVAGAFALELDAHHHVTWLGIAYAGIAATPLFAQAACQLARGEPWTLATLALLQTELGALGTPLDDQRGSAAYRRAMVHSLLARFFAETTTSLEQAG